MTDLLPTTLVGSYTRPSWLADAISESRARATPVENLDELKTQAKLLTIKEIEDAGLDIVSDGEQGRTSFYEYMTEQMSGFTFGRSKVFASGMSYIGLKKPVSRVSLNAELSTVKDAEFLKMHSSRLTKVALISPYFLANFCWEPGGFYASRDSFLEDILEASKAEARAMSGKVDYIQWDDPGITRFTEEKMSEKDALDFTRQAVEAMNAVIEANLFSVNNG